MSITFLFPGLAYYPSKRTNEDRIGSTSMCRVSALAAGKLQQRFSHGSEKGGCMRTTKIFFVLCFSMLVMVSFVGCGGGGGASVNAPSAGNSSASTTAEVTKLSWSAPTAYTDGTSLTNLAGFKIYYGVSSGTYSDVVDAGMTTSYTISGLAPGTYYFAVRAYDASGNESGYSNEASKTIPQQS
jgi:hypothetical protein